MSPLRGWVRDASAAALLSVMFGAGCAERPRPSADASNPPAASTQVAVRPAQPCDSATTQLAMTACHAQAAKDAEALEETRYSAARQALQTKAATDQIGPLEAAEQAWKQYRDAECTAAAGLYAGGSIAGLITADCRARLASERAAELKTVYLDWAAQ